MTTSCINASDHPANQLSSPLKSSVAAHLLLIEGHAVPTVGGPRADCTASGVTSKNCGMEFTPRCEAESMEFLSPHKTSPLVGRFQS